MTNWPATASPTNPGMDRNDILPFRARAVGTTAQQTVPCPSAAGVERYELDLPAAAASAPLALIVEISGDQVRFLWKVKALSRPTASVAMSRPLPSSSTR